MHGILIPVLTKLSLQDPEKWFKYVASVQRIINSTTSQATNFTPFELLFGIKMKNKEDIKIKKILEEEHYQSTLQEKERLRDEAKNNILKLQDENRRQYNKRRK
ncbi:hypothetical protein X975_13790, partial [Stegodyphus mimosarum]